MPLGLDEPRPLLGWRLAGSGRGRRQAGYRIRVVRASQGAGDPTDERAPAVWDTGQVESARSVDLAYEGEPLASRTAYRWAVRVTDESGQDSGWSEPATFETGLLGEDEWGAAWIGSDTDADLAGRPSLDLVGPMHTVQRIWLPSAGTTARERPAPADVRPPGNQAFFRTRFEIPAGRRVRTARLVAGNAGAGAVRGWLNGVGVRVDGLADDALVSAVTAGTQVLALAATGVTDGDVPGLAVRLDVELDDGSPLAVASDGTWLVSAEEPAGWTDPGYDDRAWVLAESYGQHGVPPQGREPATYRPSPYLRREFAVTEDAAPVRRARLYATALGLYEARLNGQRIGDDRLAPGWTDYAARVPYQTYDVTDLVRAGDNVLGAILADGWYAGHVGWFGAFQYGRERQFRARLEIEHADGSRSVVATDDGWRVGEGGVRYADLQNGEVVDARLEPAGWDEPSSVGGFDGSGWSPAVVGRPAHGALESAVGPPIRVEHALGASRVHRRAPGRFLVDFGQNLVGWVRLRVRGTAGQRILLHHAEVLDHHGELYLDALRSARCTDEYVLRGDPAGEVFEPRFTVHGFRYCEVSGYPGELEAEDITALVAHAAMDQVGEFSCSNAALDQLQRNIVWGQRGNFLSVPTDCPQRDERLGWTGDAQVFAATAAFNYDVRPFFRKWMRDLRDDQHADGAVPHVAPDIITAHWGAAAGAAGWGDAVEIVPLELWQAYGDTRLAEESLDAIASWLAYLEEQSDGLIRPDAGFADWLAPTSTPRDLVQTAFFAYAARVGARLARLLDRPDRAREWEQLYDRVRAAFRARFVRGGGEVGSGSQTSSILALHFGLLEPDEEPRAAARLVDEIESRNDHLATGFLGTPYLLPVLCAHGHEDVAYRLLMQDTVPSWLYPVVHGDATTIWERWDSWSDSRGFQDPAMTSFNHYAYGAVGEWIYRTVGGLAPGTPGYGHVVVRPRPGGGLTWARTALATVYGPVSVSWRLDADTFALDVTVPPNATAEIWLPAANVHAVREGGRPLEESTAVTVDRSTGDEVGLRIGSGSYSFEAAR